MEMDLGKGVSRRNLDKTISPVIASLWSMSTTNIATFANNSEEETMVHHLPIEWIRKLGLLATFAALLWGSAVWGQNKDLSPSEKTRLNAIKDGKESVTEADKTLLKNAAAFQMNRLSQSKYWRKPPPEGSRTLDELLEQDTFKIIPVPTEQKPLNDKQQEYMAALADAFLPLIHDALGHAEPIVRVNAARILARIAEAGQEKTAKEMLAVLNDKKQLDAVKHWIFRGMEGLFNASYWTAAVPGSARPNGRAFKDEALEDQCIQALVDYILSKPNISPNASPDEVRGIQYVRRAAIRALAVTRLPAIIIKKQFVGTPTALALTRVVANDGLTPPASLSERLEAAFGLCHLQTNLADNYQPDYAAHVVGLFLVDFAKEFNNNANIKPGEIKPFPWKLWAGNLLLALQGWKEANPKGTNSSGEYIEKLADKYKSTLLTVQKQQGQVDVNDLKTWLGTPPPSTSLFKNHPEMSVKAAAETAEN
jgi:hypothetical protein